MISVITITHNRRQLLKETIESVLAQTYSHFEYVIVDDGSTDGTKELVEGFNDKRIRYFYNEHSGYLSKNRNTGLANARAKIVAFIDSDDLWHTEYLKEVARIYASENVLSVVGNALILGAGEKKPLMDMSRFSSLKGNFLQQRLLTDDLIVWTSGFSFLKKDAIRFNENLKWGDSDCFLKVLAEGNSVIIAEPLVFLKKHDANVSGIKRPDSLFIKAYDEEFVTLLYLRNLGRINPRLYCKTSSRYLLKQADNFLEINMPLRAWRGYFLAVIKYPLNFRALKKLFQFGTYGRHKSQKEI